MSTLAKPTILGILNCTPDSFYDGIQAEPQFYVDKGLKLIAEGADIIDIGGESSRPGAQSVDLNEELSRVIPVIKQLSMQSNIPISIDTRKSEVAAAALDAGASIINDISAGDDSNMFPLVARYHCLYICMHMQGIPENMQQNPQYQNINQEILDYLIRKTHELLNLGVEPSKIIWDPGIGFGKSLDHNLQILKHLNLYTQRQPVLLGVSRKSFIATIDPKASDVKDRLAGSLAPLALALQAGVQYYRVHDVRETKQFFNIFNAIQST